MGTEAFTTFKSKNPGLRRNVLTMGCFGMMMLIPVLGDLSLILFELLGRRKNKEYSTSNDDSLIYNTVDVSDSQIELRMNNWSRGRSHHFMSIGNIEKVVIKDVYVDEALGKNQVKVFQFHHTWGHKPLLRYDIEDRGGFEVLLTQKGIKIEQAN